MQLTVSINKMYEDTMQRLESALSAVCNDFRPDHYTKVQCVQRQGLPRCQGTKMPRAEGG